MQMREMELAGVGVGTGLGDHLLILRERDGDRALVMGIGPGEATSIAVAARKLRPPRPLTHDLILHLLTRLQAQLKRAIIHDMRDQAFIAQLDVDTPGGVIEVDCRPSDAVALALRAGIPIYCAESVLESAGIRADELGQATEEPPLD